MRAPLALLLVAVACGCGPGHGLVTLTVETSPGTSLRNVDHLVVKVTDRSRTPARMAQPFNVAVPGGAIPPAMNLALVFGGDVNGAVTIEGDAWSTTSMVGSASTTVGVKPYQSAVGTLTFAGQSNPLDLAMSPDLTVPADLVQCMPTSVDKFVISSVIEPSQRSDFAIDLNGDGKADNQYGSIVGALSAQNLTTAAADLNGAITAGTQLMLVSEASSDAAFLSDSCPQTTYQMAQAQAAPRFDGSGMFAVDTTISAGMFAGVIGAGHTPSPGQDMAAPNYTNAFFNSASPATATQSTEVAIVVPLAFGAGALVRVALVGAHIQFENDTAGNKLVSGQLNGAIRAADIDAVIFPALATAYTLVAQRATCDSTCMTIRSLFDTGGVSDPLCPRDMASATCRNPDGSCAVANDHVISECEVATNSVMKAIFAPDVALFDGSGNYHPDPTNATKNAVSVGFGFVGVRASF